MIFTKLVLQVKLHFLPTDIAKRAFSTRFVLTPERALKIVRRERNPWTDLAQPKFRTMSLITTSGIAVSVDLAVSILVGSCSKFSLLFFFVAHTVGATTYFCRGGSGCS